MTSRAGKLVGQDQGMTQEMRRFLGAAVLLVIVLLGFFALMLPFSSPAPVTATTVNVLDQLAASKQAMLRQAMRMEAARLQQEVSHGLGVHLPRVATTTSLKSDPALKGADGEIQKAIQSIDSGNVNDAVTILESLLKTDPRNEQALVEMAMVQMLDLKQNAEAIRYLQRAMDVNPTNKVVMSELVSLYEEENRLDEGLTFLKQRVATHPEASELAYGIGQMLSLQGKEGEAIPYLEQATQNTDNPVRAYRDLAEAYSRSGEPSKAVESYAKAVSQQEREVKEKAQQGMPTTFAEERLNNTKLDQVRELIHLGDSGSLETAQKMLDEVQSKMPDLEQIAALQKSLEQKRGRAG